MPIPCTTRRTPSSGGAGRTKAWQATGLPCRAIQRALQLNVEHARFLDKATKIVVSRTLERIEWNKAQNTVLIQDNIAEDINTIKQQPGHDIWFLGSTTLAQTFMQLDLIDEYRININPTVLGSGKSLFAGVTRTFPLTLLEAQTLKSGVVALRYEPERK